ncbi:RNAseH domain-containing protein [Saccharopolyspora sp. 6M]|nr:RNaseH domain-containing protein [Saccharopolyspora sp. 6M]MCA1229824.1 RNAseH domain-containing protein [Saccharopolyspora sp. 6M]
MCHQAGSRDDRTRHPTPLHLAERADRDHPQRDEQPYDNDHVGYT